MNKLLKMLFFLVSLSLFVYVLPKSPEFPKPPNEFFQSFEPADVESPLRRGYYTNLSRDEVMSHYKKEFNNGFVYSVNLNYPPEEAQTIIRDQTKSTFLEELVHPMREGLYINGFEPKTEEYKIIVNGETWRQKIIVRYVPCDVYLRLLIMSLTIASALVLVREYYYVKK